MRRRRTLLYALLALAVPLPAFALSADQEAPAGISVSASLAGCGLVDTEIVCEIEASWTPVEHADYYTVSVTRADGSVVDHGQTGATGATVFVPYAGSGVYSVEIAAWGTPPDEERTRELARDEASSERAPQRSVTQREVPETGEPRPVAPADSDAPDASAPAEPVEPAEPEPLPEPACPPSDDLGTEGEAAAAAAVAEAAAAEQAAQDEQSDCP